MVSELRSAWHREEKELQQLDEQRLKFLCQACKKERKRVVLEACMHCLCDLCHDLEVEDGKLMVTCVICEAKGAFSRIDCGPVEGGDR